MKWWYLTCSISHEYAVVFAKTKLQAFEKIKTKRKLQTTNIRLWTIEELRSDSYDGVLYFY